jgi:tRNA(Arg) A34 adenosine deaminase TadA
MTDKFMKEAVRCSAKSLVAKYGPFGAVIVKDGKIIARAWNKVKENKDPTAHAEILAIRKAGKKLGTHRLDGCEIYSSCEPCPMCLAAIYWANISKIYFANTRKGANKIGFKDDVIYNEIALPFDKRKIPTEMIPNKDAEIVFEQWALFKSKEGY